jgi:hypothetical protein
VKLRKNSHTIHVGYQNKEEIQDGSKDFHPEQMEECAVTFGDKEDRLG